MSDVGGSGGRDPVELSNSLDAVIASLRGPDARGLAGIVAIWEDVVGELIAERARPVLFDHGTLVVEAVQPGWATQLRYLSTELCQRFAARAPHLGLREIEVRGPRR